MNHQVPRSRLVRSIQIERLFNRYSYDISLEFPHDPISILYGENGSGKTTILNLLFHLLSPEPRAGHRNWLARVPVERFEVTLMDGSKISLRHDPKAAKKNQHYVYSLQIESPQQRPRVWALTQKDLQEKTHNIEEYCAALAELNMGVYILTDARELLGSRPSPNRLVLNMSDDSIVEILPTLIQGTLAGLDSWTTHSIARRAMQRVRELPDAPKGDGDVITRAISRLHQWALNEARQSSNRGELEAHSIYARIVQHLQQGDLETPSEDIIPRLRDVAQRISGYETFGIVPKLDIQSMIDSVERLPSQKQSIVAKVLGPYVESLEQRINEHNRLKDVLEAFTSILNDFYSHKRVGYSLSSGISISLDQGRGALSPSGLSSGERQLLVLFSNIVSLRGVPSILLIDEPELSLNPTWQRKLFPALYRFVKDAEIQIICATHSMEILAQNSESVKELKDLASHV